MNKRYRTKNLLIAGAVTGVLAAGLTACGSDDDQSAEQMETSADTESSAPTEPPTEDVSPTPEALDADAEAPTAMLAAAATGLKQVPGGTLVSIDQGNSTWEIHVITSDGAEHEMDVAADGASVVRGPIVDQDDANDIAEQKALVQGKSIGYKAAAEQALADVPQGQLTELDLDSDRGQIFWEAKVLDDQSAERSITIDAATGEVVNNQLDD